MGEHICFLISILYNDHLLKVALKIHRDSLTGDMQEFYMEPENREKFHAMLPDHVRSCGPIVAMEELFEVSEYEGYE